MKNLANIGQDIKIKRLSLNLTMDYVAAKANITRATLFNIEKGSTSCSFATILKILNILDMKVYVDLVDKKQSRSRATRTNTLLNKKINDFVIMCIEQYASSVNQPSNIVYNKMKEKGILEDLKNDYEDLHGMSTASLNKHIETLL